MRPSIPARIALTLATLAVALSTGCSLCCPKSGTAALFNGTDLNGWHAVSADPSVPAAKVWSVRDGMIVCAGAPVGFLHTDRTFTNFRLQVDYRWAPGTKPGNSGIFSRIQETSRPLPRTVEVQLMNGNAGDVLTLQGLGIASGQPRSFHVAKHELAGDIDGVKKLENAERPAGDWNHLEIQARGDTYVVHLNGRKVNEVQGVHVAAGPVGLQSEGGEIHFRGVTIQPLK